MLLVALVTAGITSACTHRAAPEELAAAGGLINSTDSMRAELDRADTNALRHMGALFLAERPGIELRFKDTLNPREAQVLGNYHWAMSVRLPRLMEERMAEKARLDSTLRRLQGLRHDLEHGLMPSAARQNALRIEQQWNAVLRQDLDSITARTRALVHDRKSYRTTIDSLLRP
jgi:hypothetical protein